MTSVLLIQGANMNYLGKREPEFYGTTTADELDRALSAYAEELGYALEIFYTNIEGEAINKIYAAAGASIDGLIMNPAGFSYAGYALRDCLKAVALPYVEVHITNIERRGIKSATAEVADGIIAGLGTYGYRLAMDAMRNIATEADTAT